MISSINTPGLSEQSTIKQLIEIIHEKIAPALKADSDIILVFGGRDISKDQSKTLIQCGLIDSSTLFLVGRVIGGGSGRTQKIDGDFDEVNLSISSDKENNYIDNVFEIKFTTYDNENIFLEVSKEILVSELKTKIMKLDNCLVNSNDFKLCFNGVDLESDKPLIEYVNLSLEYNKLQFSVLNNFVQIE